MAYVLPYSKKQHWCDGLSGFLSFYTQNTYRIISHIGIISAVIFNFRIFEIFLNNPYGLIPLYLLGLTLMMVPMCILFSKLSKRMALKNISLKQKLIRAGILAALWIIIMYSEAIYFHIEVIQTIIGFFGINEPQSTSNLVFFGTLFAAICFPLTEALLFNFREIKNWLDPFNNSKSSIAKLNSRIL